MRERMVTREGRPTGHAILDMGEGWGSIGIAAAEMKEGCYTVRVDRAVNLDQGSKIREGDSEGAGRLCSTGQGELTEEGVEQHTEPASFLLIWLSPECTILSASQHNKSGNRRGKRAVGAVSRGNGNNDNRSQGRQDERAGGVPASNRSTDGGTGGRRAPGSRAAVRTGESNGQRPVDTAVSGRQDQAQCGVDTHQGRH